MAKRRRAHPKPTRPNPPPDSTTRQPGPRRPSTSTSRGVRPTTLLLGLGALAAIGILAVAFLTSGEEVPPAATGINGVTCDRLEHTEYHVHSHLAITFDGAAQPVPVNIGIRSTCIYWLHTHSPNGILHVEAPASATFTLGDFFDVWGEPLSSSQVLDRTTNSNEQLFVFVDGQLFEGDPRTIELTNHRNIELQIGSEALPLQPWEWPEGF
jgi:hypothetical protein